MVAAWILTLLYTGRSTLAHVRIIIKHVSGDRISWALRVLLAIRLAFCLLRAYRACQANQVIRLIISGLVVICRFFFSRRSWVGFYLFFELSLIPIFFLILGWGYQRERLIASKALFFYTFSSSMPLFLIILDIRRKGAVFLHQVEYLTVRSRVVKISTVFFSGAFLVKLPIFWLHIWLPKAHVEAPVIGSMFLAAILLKIGRFGILKVYSALRGLGLILNLVLRLSAWRFVVVTATCFQSSDLKVLIAFSSVRHIALLLVIILRGRECGLQGALIIILGHGIRSSMIFYISYLIYTRSSTRSLILNKRLKIKGGLINFMWCLSCLGILGGPPTSNLWFEVNAFFVLCLSTPPLVKIAFWAGLITGVYSLVCLRSVYSGNIVRYSTSTRPRSATDCLTIRLHRIILIRLVVLILSI